MKCVILQPSYIPWRGYFHQIQKADVFVFYDDVQYDKHGWRNRNRIKTHQGSKWLTIPVHASDAPVQHTPIRQVQIDNRQEWQRKHWTSLQQSYSKAPYFSQYAPLLEPFYQQPTQLLADFTIALTIALARQLGIDHTRFLRSSDMKVSGVKTDRLINILCALGADHYISGPSARDYIELDRFVSAGIALEYMEYNYPVYEQLYPPYDPQVTILDLIFMTGKQALSFIV
jgi:hypothetical protein